MTPAGNSENLYNNVPADTLVNARPIISAIEAQANSPNVSAAQKAELLARRDYLTSMTYGQPGYNGRCSAAAPRRSARSRSDSSGGSRPSWARISSR